MADKKISALPAASTPLAGTEVLPIVQGGVTDQVSVANLTTGRDVAVKKLNPTDNVVMAAGKGIDFSANGGDVLSQYDEGTWTPTFSGWSANPTTVTAEYTRIGRQVTLTARFYGGVTAGAGLILGFPFTASASGGGAINASTEGNPTTQISGIVNGGAYYAQNINAVTLTSTYWVFSTTFFI